MSNLKPDKLAKGLANYPGENNCFLNCAVQVLWHLPSFSQSLYQLSGHRCSGALACIFCAFKVTFAQLLYSDQTTLLPDTMRKALAMAFSEEQRFQMGSMDDAAECLEMLLNQLHLHLCPQPQDFCKEQFCISHEKFSMDLTEEIICKCLAHNEPLNFQQIVQYISAEALISEIRHLLISSTYQPQLFDKILSRAINAGDLRDCPLRCGWKAQIQRTLHSNPDFVTFGLAWDNNKVDIGRLRDIWESIGSSVRLSELFDKCEDESGRSRVHHLRSIICFYGKHYSAFCLCDDNWIHYDDHIVNRIGSDWSDVVSKCIQGRFRPVVLLYSQDYPKPFNPSLSMKETKLVPMEDFKHSSGSLKRSTLTRPNPDNNRDTFLHGGSHFYSNLPNSSGGGHFGLASSQPQYHSTETLLDTSSLQSTLDRKDRRPGKPPCPPRLSNYNLSSKSSLGRGSSMSPELSSPASQERFGRPPAAPDRRNVMVHSAPYQQDNRSRYSNSALNSGGNNTRRSSESSLSLSIRGPSPSPAMRHLIQPLQPSPPASSRSSIEDNSHSYINRSTVAQILQLQRQHRSASATRVGVPIQMPALPTSSSFAGGLPLDRLTIEDRNSKMSSLTSDSGISGDGSTAPSMEPNSPTNLIQSGLPSNHRVLSHRQSTQPDISPGRNSSSSNDAPTSSPGYQIPSPDQIQDLFNSLPRRHSATKPLSHSGLSIYGTTGRRSSQPVVNSLPSATGSISSSTVVSLSTSSSSSSLVAPTEGDNSWMTSHAPPLKLLSNQNQQICPNCRSYDGWQSEILKCLKCKAVFTREELEKKNAINKVMTGQQPTRSCLAIDSKISSKVSTSKNFFSKVSPSSSTKSSSTPKMKKSVTFHEELCTVVNLTPQTPPVSPFLPDDNADQFNSDAFKQRVLVNSQFETDKLNNNVSPSGEQFSDPTMCNLCHQTKVTAPETFCSSCSIYMKQFS